MKAGIWIRVSTDEQAESDSPATHKKRGTMYAEMKGWDVVNIYSLPGVSGKSIIGHPETQRMLKDVKAGRIEALIFSKLARLARNVRELLEISEIFKQHDAALVSLGESIDTSTPAGQLMYTMIAALAEWERAEISARVKASVPIRAAAGKPTGGMAPWGYAWVDNGNGKKLEIDQEEAERIRPIFQLCLEEKGNLRRTAERCNVLGYLSRNKLTWSVTQLKRVIDNEIYIGRRRANYSQSTGDGKHWVEKPESEWVYHEVEPLIDLDIFKRVQIFRGSRKGSREGVAPPKDSKYLFGGILQCHCKTKSGLRTKLYSHWIDKEGVPTYRCRNCNQKILETEIIESVTEAFKTIKFLPEQTKQPETINVVQVKKQVNQALLTIKGLTKKKSRFLDLYAEEEIERETLLLKLQDLENEQATLTMEANRLSDIIDTHTAQKSGMGGMIKKAAMVADRFSKMTFDEKKEAIDVLISAIHVTPESIDILLLAYPGITDLRKESHMVMGVLPIPEKRKTVIYSLELLRKSSRKPTTLGAKLKHEREKFGWYQKDLAWFLGISEGSIVSYEKGKIPQRRYRRLIDYFLVDW